MENTFVECMTRSKNVASMRFLKILCIMLAVGFFFIGTVYWIAFIIAIAAGVGAWFASLNASIEFEYQYLDKELGVDKILNKSRRKHVGTYDLGKMEIFAPINSHHLDEYKNRELKTLDYAAAAEQPDVRYVMILEGKERLILEPSEGLVKAVKSIAPRKVFTD